MGKRKPPVSTKRLKPKVTPRQQTANPPANQAQHNDHRVSAAFGLGLSSDISGALDADLNQQWVIAWRLNA
jgi:hypothetical protein